MTINEKQGGSVVARLLNEREISRRSFLKGGGMLVIGLGIAGVPSRAGAANNPHAISARHTGAIPGPTDATQIDSYLEINPDNTATLYTGWVELGQGTPTSLRMIAAEELGLTFDQVELAQVDTNVSLSAATVASSSTMTAMRSTSLRGAAAGARQILLGLASPRLGVPVGNLSVTNGVVAGGGKSLRYSDLIGEAPFGSTIAAQNVTLTAPANYRLIGTRVPRQDVPGIVTGTGTYIQNVRVPGMLHGRVVRPPGQAALGEGAPVVRVDKSSVSHIPDVQVVQVGNFLAVVAPLEFSAIRAAAELKVTWADTPKLLPGDRGLAAALRDPANLFSQGVEAATGDVGSGLASAAKVVSRSYFSAYQMHGALGPNCAVADVTSQGAVIFCATQIPYSTRAGVITALNVARPSGFSANNVRVQVYPGSGTYGHSAYDDATISAALMSQAVGKPVRAQFMRWDEHGWDQYGPAQVADVMAGIDTRGNIVAFDYTAWLHGWTQSTETAAELAGVPIPASPPLQNADTVSSASYYAIPNRRVTSKRVNGYDGFLKGTYLRAPQAPQSLFAAESMIDELAHLANMDPVAFRIQNIDANQINGNARWIAVLNAAAEAASWKPKVAASKLRSGDVVTGRGVAIGGFAGSFPAIVADITVNKKSGKIVANHLFAAQDAGTTVNPASVENQMSGCLIQGCSRALLEEVRFTKERQTSLDWVSYPILRFKEAPNVTTVVVQRMDQPSTGSGEPTTAAVAAAIGNAFFDATGVRLLQTPMTPGYVRGMLASNAKVAA
jgi:CO/xanthine dehydrogenase Mo-binding subunit